MAALRPGQMLEGTSYQVVREIGAGGMGVVYEIEHVRLKKRYVAKVIHETIKNDESARKRMEREAQVLAGLSHPNVVQVHDVGTTSDDTHYFVMEKLEGVDLRRFMKRAMPRARALAIVADVLDALDYVHKRGIVHRDIKPENIFLADLPNGGQQMTKVLDFGIVHIFDADGRVSHGRITKTGGFAGTLYYAAPEQMQGKPPGPGTDVYAAGLVLFELLAGKGPFDDDPGVGLSRCFKPAPHLCEMAPSLPRVIGDVIARALLQEPSQRPPAGWFAQEVRRLVPLLADGVTPAAIATDDDTVGAEVDDLLNAMPVHSTGKKNANPLGQVQVQGGGDSPHHPPHTNVPATPLMAGAPPRHPTPVDAATMASAQLTPSQPPPPPPQPHHPTNLGLGAQPPAAAAAAALMPTIGSARSMPSPLAQTNDAPQRYSTPGGAPPISPRVPPMGLARAETAPGTYATVDGLAPISNPQPSSATPGAPGWAPIAGVAAAILLALGLIGGALIYKHETTATKTPDPSPPAPTTPLPPTSASIAATTSAPTPTPARAPDPTGPAAAATTTTAATASTTAATPTATATAPTTTTTATSKPTGGSPAKPAAPPPPRPTSSKGGDGYLKEL
jgi:eukaryotic-like serine/threonine-protein kinase